MDKFINILDEDFTGLSFTNLVDFDAKFGHRRDPIGMVMHLKNLMLD